MSKKSSWMLPLLSASLLFGSSLSFGHGHDHSMAKMTDEQRMKAAEMFEKAAVCMKDLKGKTPAQCHEDMEASCPMKDEGGCPMMGGGHHMGKGKGGKGHDKPADAAEKKAE